MAANNLYTLLPCPSCAHQMSVDAETCPQCGGNNNWIHPILQRVIDHLNTLPCETRFEAQGHRMHLYTEHKNLRQHIGGWMLFCSMILLVLGLFSATFLSLSILCMCIGGFLTMFGLSFSNHYELNIDLRTASKIVGAHDKRFWADVKRIIHEQSATTKKE